MKSIEYDEAKLGQIEGLAAAGLTLDKVAAYLGIGRTTFYEHRKENPNIQERYELGLARAEAVIGKSLYDKAKTGDMAAIRWWEITRAGRSEKKEIEVTDKRSVVALDDPVTEEEWEAEHGGDSTLSDEG